LGKAFGRCDRVIGIVFVYRNCGGVIGIVLLGLADEFDDYFMAGLWVFGFHFVWC